MLLAIEAGLIAGPEVLPCSTGGGSVMEAISTPTGSAPGLTEACGHPPWPIESQQTKTHRTYLHLPKPEWCLPKAPNSPDNIVTVRRYAKDHRWKLQPGCDSEAGAQHRVHDDDDTNADHPP